MRPTTDSLTSTLNNSQALSAHHLLPGPLTKIDGQNGPLERKGVWTNLVRQTQLFSKKIKKNKNNIHNSKIQSFRGLPEEYCSLSPVYPAQVKEFTEN